MRAPPPPGALDGLTLAVLAAHQPKRAMERASVHSTTWLTDTQPDIKQRMCVECVVSNGGKLYKVGYVRPATSGFPHCMVCCCVMDYTDKEMT